MLKKIKDLTFDEVVQICENFNNDCKSCPFNLPGDDCYRNNFHERKYMEEKEIILDSPTVPKAQ